MLKKFSVKTEKFPNSFKSKTIKKSRLTDNCDLDYIPK